MSGENIETNNSIEGDTLITEVSANEDNHTWCVMTPTTSAHPDNYFPYVSGQNSTGNF